ncbi:MAG: type IV pilus modification protein PilV [Kangiellaceae bacterium]|nr:type IV pilus modification protein PilV [Kangiellaceae bacterium]|tara:strand:+ start:2854 stop:3408 length:555 start_codon:yes stop_codon:yes gene_type:complete
MRTLNRTKLSNIRGFALIEALISLLILAVGLLGIAGLQSASIQSNHSSFLRSTAMMLAYELNDRIRATYFVEDNATLRGDIPSYFSLTKNDSPGSKPDCIANPCMAKELAEFELYQWLERVETILPLGDATVTVEDAPGNDYGNTKPKQITVVIFYKEVRELDQNSDDPDIGAEDVALEVVTVL